MTPVVANDRCMVQSVLKPAEVPQLQYLTWWSMSLLCSSIDKVRRLLSRRTVGGASDSVLDVFEAVVEAFFAACCGIFGLLLTELSPGLQRTFWGALDDEEFFVVEGSGVAGTPGVSLPGVLPQVN